jgi:hypothetical protein
MIQPPQIADRRKVSNEENQPELNLRSFTYQERSHLLPELGVAIDMAGGWVMERRSLSADALELQLEVQLQALPEVYGALLGSGLEITRDSHRALAERCNCSLHLRPRRGVSSILLMRLEVNFLPDPPQPLDMSWLTMRSTATA